MHYEIVKSKELGFNEKRYIVVNKRTGKLIDDCNKYGFLSPKTAISRVCKRISMGELKGITENDIVAVESDELSGNRAVYVIVDTDSNTVIDNNCGVGWTQSRYAKSNLMGYIKQGSEFKPYEYQKMLERDLYDFEMRYLRMNRLSIYKGIIYNIRNSGSLEYDEIKTEAYKHTKKLFKLKREDDELFFRLFDFCYNQIFEKTEIKRTADFNFGEANDEQREAIAATEGPLLIIAGPGTGKTFTLVKRIV